MDGPGSADFLAEVGAIALRPSPPPQAELASALAAARASLALEAPALRPRDRADLPGGILNLPRLPTAILPDLHARPDFLAAALAWKPPRLSASLAQLLEAGEASLVCLGDLFHSEAEGAAAVWKAASLEYLSGWERRGAMDTEMGRALAVALLVLRCKAAFPARFHCLKGNHDNIANEEGRGDHPFYKYAMEGEMASSWFLESYGRELLSAYREFELDLPLVARGERFVASHAEPAFALSEADIVEYRRRPEVVEALIWTPNDGAEAGSVSASLLSLLGSRAEGALWFGGHRPIEAGLRYQLRAGGRYVQFHAPGKRRLAWLDPGRNPDPERDILSLEAPPRP
jgi:hypothetical protein